MLHRLLRLYRLLHRLNMRRRYRRFSGLLRGLTRLSRRIRRLVLVLRRLRRNTMFLTAAGSMIHTMYADFAHAFVFLDVIVDRILVITFRLHAFQWAIAEYRRPFFTASPETMYQ
jgi:hypothetical protein